MRPFSKGFAFVPLLIVFFLLVVSAVTSYVVINQGTGGYSSRAAGTGSCSTSQCVSTGTVNLSPQCSPNTYCSPNAPYTSVCTADIQYRQSGDQNIAHYNCAIGASCSNNAQCTSGKCTNGSCAASTPVTVSGSCSSSTNSSTCNSRSNVCIWDAAHSTCKDKIAEGQRCFLLSGAVPCQSGLTCVDDPTSNASANGLCKRSTAVTPTSAASPCNVVGAKCCYLYVGGTVGTSYYCHNNLQCSLQSPSATCRPYPSNAPTDPKPTATPTPADPKPTSTPVPVGGGGGGGGGGNPPPSNLTCAGGILCDGTPITGTAGQTVCGQKDSSGTCRTSQCNGSTGQWTYVGAACTLPIVTPSPVPGTTGDVTLNFTLRLQGVTAQPRGGQTVPFKVKLKGPSVKDYVSGTLAANSAGKWTGSVAFTGISVGASTKYTVYIKVGKHLQKRVCAFEPTETSGGLYNCTDSAIPLTAGANNLDFSGIMLLAGDLPSSTGEQNGVVDSYDISYILNNLGATDTTKMAIGDLNFDGVIDTQDRSLIIQSLNVKYDDQ